MANKENKFDGFSDDELYEMTKTTEDLSETPILRPLLTALILPPVAFAFVYCLLKLIGWV